MSAPDIHPEELFDRLVEGSLSAAESERLRAHLDVCDVCRFELAVRGDFRADAPDVARPASRAPHVAPRRRGRRAFAWMGAAAAFLVASGALGAILTGVAPWELVRSSSDSAPAVSTRSAKARPGRPAATSLPTVATPSVSAQPVTDDVSLPPAADDVGAPRATGAVNARPPARSSAPRAAANAEPATAAGLFAAANRARGAGDVAQAVTLYHRLQREFPASSEAVLSQLTLATLLLHGGDSRAALASFDAYLARSSRPLEAEALVGRALALRALGDREAEVAAWQTILRRHPGSSYARRATERLAAIGRL